MLNLINSQVEYLKDFFNICLFSAPIIFTTTIILQHLYENFLDNQLLNDSFNTVSSVSPTYEESVFFLQDNFKAILEYKLNDFSIYANNQNNNDDLNTYFKHIKVILGTNSENDFNFFLSKMNKQFKNKYITLFNLLLTDITFNDFLGKTDSINSLYILNKKILNIKP